MEPTHDFVLSTTTKCSPRLSHTLYRDDLSLKLQTIVQVCNKINEIKNIPLMARTINKP